MDFQVGEEKPLPGIDEHVTVLTQLESSAQEIHKNLNAILDYQTHHRLREAQGEFIVLKILLVNIYQLSFISGRKRAEDLNERVLWWSFSETFSVLIITISQVLILRNFFAEKKPSQMGTKIYS